MTIDSASCPAQELILDQTTRSASTFLTGVGTGIEAEPATDLSVATAVGVATDVGVGNSWDVVAGIVGVLTGVGSLPPRKEQPVTRVIVKMIPELINFLGSLPSKTRCRCDLVSVIANRVFCSSTLV